MDPQGFGYDIISTSGTNAPSKVGTLVRLCPRSKVMDDVTSTRLISVVLNGVLPSLCATTTEDMRRLTHGAGHNRDRRTGYDVHYNFR